MPTVCVYRPNRTEGRPFSARDAARVAKYAARRHGSMNVAAAVIAALEIDDAVCILDCCLDTPCPQTNTETVEQKLKEVKQLTGKLRSISVVRPPLARALVFAIDKGVELLLDQATQDVLDTTVELDCAARKAENAYLCALIARWKTDLLGS